MKSNYLILMLSIAVVLVLSSCERKVEKKLVEGVITYDIDFLNIPKGSPVAMFLPDEMTLIFKNNKTRLDMEVGFGMLKMSYISDSKAGEVITLVNYMGTKRASIQTKEEVQADMGSTPKYVIMETEEFKIIENWNCRRASARIDDTHLAFPIYYTEEVGGNSINWNTPYRDIHGILLDYRWLQNGMEMHLTANNVHHKEVSNELFTFDESSYEVIPRKDFDAFMEKLMQNAGF